MRGREGVSAPVQGEGQGVCVNAVCDALTKCDDVVLGALRSIERELGMETPNFDVLTDEEVMTRLRPTRLRAYEELDPVVLLRRADVAWLRGLGVPVDEGSAVVLPENRVFDLGTGRTRFYYDRDFGDEI